MNEPRPSTFDYIQALYSHSYMHNIHSQSLAAKEAPKLSISFHGTSLQSEKSLQSAQE